MSLVTKAGLLTSACRAQADESRTQQMPTALKNDRVLDMLLPPAAPPSWL
jgi:hypothetical protein